MQPTRTQSGAIDTSTSIHTRVHQPEFMAREQCLRERTEALLPLFPRSRIHLEIAFLRIFKRSIFEHRRYCLCVANALTTADDGVQNNAFKTYFRI